MNKPGDRSSARDDHEPDDHMELAMRAAFGPASTATVWNRRGVLEALRQSTGVTSRVLLRDEPDAPSPVVGTGEESLAAGGRVPYQVLGEVARGGMGIILKGRDADLGRDVAIKVLHPGHAGDRALVQRFIEEAQIGGQLQHPGILPVYELGLDTELRPYFTMRLVKGRSLAALLEERTHSMHDLGRFLAIFEQACQAVAYAHARGVIHRDLKPSNIMIGAFGEVQVVDWGLSKVLKQGAEAAAVAQRSESCNEPQVTTIRTTGGGAGSQSGAVIGTPSYMSPEQALGAIDELDEQADVFALGAILCEILTGQPPYLGSRSQILEDAAVGTLGDAFARLESCGAEDELVRLAERCLAPARDIRPRHAGVVAREVSGFLASVAERARTAAISAAEARGTAAAERKGRRRITLLASMLALAILVGTLFAITAERTRRARAEQSIANLAAIYRKASWFRDQAEHIPAGMLDLWAQALAQVRVTAEIIGAGAIGDEAERSVARLIDELKREEQRVRERAHQPAGSPGPLSSPAVAPAEEPNARTVRHLAHQE
jgi:serine/threonine-protein kinase